MDSSHSGFENIEKHFRKLTIKIKQTNTTKQKPTTITKSQ